MKGRRQVRTIVGIVVAALVLTPACGYWEARRKKQDAIKREAERAKTLAEGLQTVAAQNLPQETEKLRGLLKDPGEIPKHIPEWKVYQKQVSTWLELTDRVAKAAAERRHQDVAAPAVEGFASSGSLMDQSFKKSKELLMKAEPLIEAGKFAAVDEVQTKAEIYLSLSKISLLEHKAMYEPLQLVALNAPKADRLATFELLAGTYPTLGPDGGGIKLGLLMRLCFSEETDAENKARMEQVLRQHNLPLTRPEEESGQAGEKGKAGKK